MNSLQAKILGFLSSEDGPTAVEYAIMLAFIIVGSILAISQIGTTTSNSFVGVNAGLIP
jgi:pilus assembly protein Flp/PilA